MFGAGERGDFMKVVFQSGSLLRNEHKASRDRRGLRIESHHLVTRGRDGANDPESVSSKLLDELRSRSLVLD